MKDALHLFNRICIGLMIAFLGVMMFYGCSSGDSQQAGGAREVQATGYLVEPAVYTYEVQTTGELAAWEEVDLRTPVAGNVLGIFFEEGQAVKRGDLLVSIDSRALVAQKNALEARLAPAKNDLSRKQGLLEIEGATSEEIDQARATLEHLEAQIDELIVRIELSQIRAPFAGTLGMRDFSVGSYLSQGEPVTKVVQTNKLKLIFPVPARYAADIKSGDKVMAESRSSGEQMQATVYAIEPNINPTTRNREVRARVDNAEQRFLPGDFARVSFTLGENEESMLIPAEAIIPELNAEVVYIVKDGIARRTTVETGGRTPEKVQITQGLAFGDTVLVTGLMAVRDGQRVSLTQLTMGEDSQ